MDTSGRGRQVGEVDGDGGTWTRWGDMEGHGGTWTGSGEMDRSGGDGQKWGRWTEVGGDGQGLGDETGRWVQMGKMGPQGRDEHRTAERYTEKVTGRGEQRLRSMGQVGEVATETWGKGDWMALNRSREKNRDRGSEVSSRKADSAGG